MRGKRGSVSLIIATGIIIAVFISILLYFGGINTLDVLEKDVDDKWVDVFMQSSQLNEELIILVQTAKRLDFVEGSLFNNLDRIEEDATRYRKTFGAANTPEKIQTAIQESTSFVNRYKALGLTPENYPELENNQNFLKQYYLFLDSQKVLSQRISAYAEALDEYNTMLHTFPISLTKGNQTELVSHFDREY